MCTPIRTAIGPAASASCASPRRPRAHPAPRERDEERVPLRVDLDAAVLCERVAHHTPVLGQQLRIPLAELVQQPRRALDVREQERHRAGRQLSAHAMIMALTAERLQIGVQLPEVEREVRWPELLAIARSGRGRRVRLDLARRPHALPRRRPAGARPVGRLDELAALAAATERVRLGPLVAATAFHPPGLIARMAAAVDEVSRRALVARARHGLERDRVPRVRDPFDRRVARFEEAFEIIRRLLAGERVTFEGRFHRVEDAVLLPTPQRPVPLMVGSAGRAWSPPRRRTWPVELLVAWYGNTPAGFAELSSRFAGFPPQRVRARERGRRRGRAAARRGLTAGRAPRFRRTSRRSRQRAQTRRSSCSTRSTSGRSPRSRRRSTLVSESPRRVTPTQVEPTPPEPTFPPTPPEPTFPPTPPEPTFPPDPGPDPAAADADVRSPSPAPTPGPVRDAYDLLG